MTISVPDRVGLSETLSQRTFRGLFWSSIERIGQQTITFVVTMAVARLLTPENYGLIGMLGIFMALATVMVDSGLGRALIQKQDLTQADESSVFFLNVVVGCTMTAVIWLSTPAIAAFYGKPELGSLARVFCLTIAVDSFSVVQRALLARRLDFANLARISMCASALSGGAGIVLARHGFGAWSLVGQGLTLSTVSGLLLWASSSWRPILAFEWRALRTLLTFGWRLLASGILDTLVDNGYSVAIGKRFSSADLGFYTTAHRISYFPTTMLSAIVAKVTLPVFSQLQADPDRLRRVIQRAVRYLVFVNFPVMMGLAAVAHPLVISLLTAKWAQSIPYLRLFCAVGMLYPLHIVNLDALLATGRSDLFLTVTLVKRFMAAPLLALAILAGIKALLVGMVVSSVVAFVINSRFTGKMLGYGPWRQTVDLFPALVSALLAHVLARAMLAWMGLPPLPALIAGGTLYGIAYLLFSAGLNRTVFRELVTLAFQQASTYRKILPDGVRPSP